jgi:hypothetical protein
MPDNRKNQRVDKNRQQPGQKKREGGTDIGNDSDRDEDQIITQRSPRMDDQNKDNSESDVE